MLGPKGASLLQKLGRKPAYLMNDAELTALVQQDRDRRTKQRALARVVRIAAPKEKKGKVKSKAPEIVTLESLGLAPTIVEKLRASGKSDADLIRDLRKAGLFK